MAVNGTVVTELGTKADPDRDEIRVDGCLISTEISRVYIMLNKPRGYVTTLKDPEGRPIVRDLLRDIVERVFPVGRLDYDSEGLLILTNDGDFAFQMTHPKFYKVKVYGVHLDRDLEPLHQQMISDHGVTLEDGPSKFELEKVLDDRRDMWRIHMSEGRNRQIRRTFAALGYTVTALHRTDFGPYHLGDLPSGQYEVVTKL